MRRWVTPPPPSPLPSFPLRALSTGSSSRSSGWGLPRLGWSRGFCALARVPSPRGGRDSSPRHRPEAPVCAHTAGGSIAAAFRPGSAGRCSPSLPFLVRLCSCMCIHDICVVRLLRFASWALFGTGWPARRHRVAGQKAPAGSSMQATIASSLELFPG